MAHDPYVYPGTTILRNRFGLRDAEALEQAEKLFVTQRIQEGMPYGKFDLAHLCAIHRHLFQDLYDWAGKLRTVEMAKGESQFMPFSRIVTGFADIEARLIRQSGLQYLSAQDFAREAAVIIGDINHAHPFREGNGRTQLLYLEQLAGQAGHPIDLLRLNPAPWMEACIASHRGEYGLTETLLRELMIGARADHEPELGIDR